MLRMMLILPSRRVPYLFNEKLSQRHDRQNPWNIPLIPEEKDAVLCFRTKVKYISYNNPQIYKFLSLNGDFTGVLTWLVR